MNINSRIQKFFCPAFALATILAGGFLADGALAVPVQQDIGFIEKFALSENRAKELEQLVPGSDDYYYFHCLHFLNQGQLDRVSDLLNQWDSRNSGNARYELIRNRLALAGYDNDPEKTLTFLKDRLSVNLNHQREIPQTQRDLPESLDPALIDTATLIRESIQRDRGISRIEDSLLEELAGVELSDEQLTVLIGRIRYADYPNLVDLVVKEMKNRPTTDFGRYEIHRQMTVEQLKECSEKIPALKVDNGFIDIYISKLVPSEDIDWRADQTEHRDYLERLREFVSPLAPKFNSLKACVLYRLLDLDRQEEKYDSALFLEYLKLPRQLAYVNPEFIRSVRRPEEFANLSENFQDKIMLLPIYDDTGLVAEFLQHFLADANTTRDYSQFIETDFLDRQMAIGKILRGLGDTEKLASILSPQEYQNLLNRIDLDFASTNKEFHGPNDQVNIELYTKNIQSLIVKVFEINTHNYYRKHQREIDTDVNLDGLVPNHEQTFEYTVAPALRIKRTFPIEGIDGPGVYIIDFIAGGKSSRALIRKGRLSIIEETTVAGHLFRVVDQDEKIVNEANLWIDGRRYDANENGVIAVPFTDNPTTRQAIINSGSFSCLQPFRHRSENYRLDAALMLDRESLLRSNEASVLIRPRLTVAGIPAGNELLEDVRLNITSTDLDGHASTRSFADLELSTASETTCKFIVPPRLNVISMELTATVKNISGNRADDLAVSRQWVINEIDKTDVIQDLHLVPHAGGYSLEVLGKSGEIRAAQSVRLSIKVRGIAQPVTVDLQSAANGMIDLGELKNVESIEGNLVGGSNRSWLIDQPSQTFYASHHALVGQTVSLPAPDCVTEGSRNEISLYEIRNGRVVGDMFDKIEVAAGLINLKGLPRGDFRLRIKELDELFTIRVTEGKPVANQLRGDYRELEFRGGMPVHFKEIKTGEDAIEIQIGNANEWTRVHVVATRYEPRFESFNQLATVRDIEPATRRRAIRRSVYFAGRAIGDEYQYILDRKSLRKYPGNMLDRPGLLVNPWAVRDTSNQQEVLAAGSDYGIVGNDAQEPTDRAADDGDSTAQNSDFANLDFLKDASLVAVNLRADENGVIRIDRKELGNRQFVQVILVDSVSTAVRDVTLPVQRKELRDLRMTSAMDPGGHFSQVKQIDVLKKNQAFKIDDIVSSEFQYFDDLAGVWRLLGSLSGDAAGEFKFVLEWPELEPEKKQELYNENACHELNFFLMKKDPEFFRDVVVKHIQNKRDKTFMDHYLLGHELNGFLEPWKYARLNTVERILLAQRIEEQTANIARNIEELYQLAPTPRNVSGTYFDASLGAAAMDPSEGGFASRRDSLRREQQQAGEQEMPSLEKGFDESADLNNGPVGGQHYGRESRGIGGGGYGGGGGGLADAPGAPPVRFNRAEEMDESSSGEQLLETELNFEDAAGGIVVDGLKDKSQFRYAPAQQFRSETRTRSLPDGTVEAYIVQVPFTENIESLRGLRQMTESLYRPVGTTKEWIENNYWHLLPEQTTADRIGPNRFWRDFANHKEGPFISTYFAEANRNLTEIMFAVAVLDLPFKGDEHKFDYADATMTLDPVGPLVVLHQQVRPTVFNRGNTTILVSENFFQKNDRYKFEDGLQVDKFVSGEFYAHTLYGGQVVITNPTSTPRPIDLLIQIPKGAVIASGSKETNSMPLDLAAFSTQTYEYSFYFPTEGEFTHFPAHVSTDEMVLAVAEQVDFKVVDRPVDVDKSSWEYISQNGSEDDVIRYINNNNIQRLNLDKIAFRMKDKAFFLRAIQTLHSRFVYNHQLWAYSLAHNDLPALKEFLTNAANITGNLGLAFDSTLLTINPVERDWYYHKEYSPLINARTHRVGPDNTILNPEFYQQYHQLMELLSNHRELTVDDHLVVTYYLLLQDRVDEAISHFNQVTADRTEAKLQYDYCDAYIDFFLEQPGSAMATAQKWEDYPVLYWQKRFRNIIAQAKEIETGIAEVTDEESNAQQQTGLASKSGSFEFEIVEGNIVLKYQNLRNVTANYYEMDIELLFSRSPFAQDQLDGFSMIRPNMTAQIELEQPADNAPAGTHEFKIPGEFANKNVLVEIVSGDQTRSSSYFENSLDVQMIEKYGQLRITDDGASTPVAKAYVKVYARDSGGNIRFHKDGYTDLRGRFDYVSQSNNSIDDVVSYSVLIMDPDRGAVIRQAGPPSR